ncbi:hypothetical protein HOY82DRAFT_597555 [Tuber indicum]|nr:hypothetical protein HOY82DRAFT_597555 [Tuber indicum]
MSQVSVEHLLLENLDCLVEQKDCVYPDSELFISLFDNEPGFSEGYNAGTDFTCPPETHAPEGDTGPRCYQSPESSQIERAQEDVVSPAVKKKRKSWGQELPIPTTNLPPRQVFSKRAKTDEEKEQRRIERILRNRAAAQSSRERKQKEVEAIDKERQRLAECDADMRVRLAEVEESNRSLRHQLGEMQQILKRYEEHMQVAACDVAVNSIGEPAGTSGPTIFFGAPEPSVNGVDNLFQFLDTIDAAPSTTIDDSVVGAAGRQSTWQPPNRVSRGDITPASPILKNDPHLRGDQRVAPPDILERHIKLRALLAASNSPMSR